jgi:hypothetical protein
MTKRQLQQKTISLSVLLLSLSTVATSMGYKTGLPIANTAVWWSVNAFVLFAFFVGKNVYFNQSNSQSMRFIQWYLLWNVFSVLRGMFIAENYWDWKFLTDHTMCLLIPIVAYSASNEMLMQFILRSYIKFALPFFAVLYFLILPDAYGYYLMVIPLLTLFFPVLTFRWKIILVAISIFVILAELNARSNVIKYSIPILFSLIYYFRLLIPATLFEIVRKALFIIPILLFSLAVTDVFNVFKMDQYVEGDYSATESRATEVAENVSLKADTRTFLYVEVLDTFNKHNDWFMGRSPARGYESPWFGADDPAGRWERYGCEVSILNVFTWTGIIGVILYLMVFYRATYLAVNYSNNTFSKIVGLFVAFRWLYAWVEDFNNFNVGYFCLWFMIGLCYSKSFRAMTNKEVEYWVQGIFDKRVKTR